MPEAVTVTSASFLCSCAEYFKKRCERVTGIDSQNSCGAEPTAKSGSTVGREQINCTAVHSNNYSHVIADNVWTPAERICGTTSVSECSLRLVVVVESVRVLSVDADVGWHSAAGKPSINIRANERRTDAGKARWRQLGARQLLF